MHTYSVKFGLDVLGRFGNSPGLAGSGTFELRAKSIDDAYERLKDGRYVRRLTGFDLTGARILSVTPVD